MFYWRSLVDGSVYSAPLATPPCRLCATPCVLTHPVCVEHARTTYGVEVRRSATHGMGLFAARPHARRALICPYGGIVCTKTELDSMYGPMATAAYACTRSDGLVHEAGATRGLGSNANDGQVYGSNAEFCDGDDGGVWLRALVDVPAGVEILVNYGSEYRHADHECRTELPADNA